MGDEIDISVVQRTQQKLGKYIQRPQLTEKLLRRPPFRFLHDIVAAASKQYGILDGVFSKEELTSDNIKDKENKIAFLQKLIKYISAELKEELNVKPTKIVAGSEPEKTNELLQALASLLERNQKSKKFQKPTTTEKNNANNTKTAAKPTLKTEKLAKSEAKGEKTAKSEAKTEKNEAKTEKNQTKPTKSEAKIEKPATKTEIRNENSEVKSAKPAAKTEPSEVKTEKSEKPEIEESEPEVGKLDADVEKLKTQTDKPAKPETITEKPEAKTDKSAKPEVKTEIKSAKSEARAEKSEAKTEKSARLESRTEKSAKPELKTSAKTKETSKTVKPASSASPIRAASSAPRTDIAPDDGEIAVRSASKRKSSPKKKKEIVSDSSVLPGDSELLEPNDDKPVDTDQVRDKRPNRSAGIRNDRLPNDDGPAAVSENDPSEVKRPVKEVSKLAPPEAAVKDGFEKPIAIASASPSRPVTGNGSLPTRPSSSRRPPSRAVRNNLTVIHQDSRPFGGHVPRVIVEGNPLSDDEEDKIVEGAVFDQIVGDFSLNDDVSTEEAEQGKLVEQIRSAQKKLDPSADTDLESKESATNKIQNLKSVIQEMAQSAIPLGHLIPVIHEDMETMFLEWQFWKKEAESLQEHIHREESVADPHLERLQAELEALDKSIQEQKIKLNVAKASVLRSENDVSLVISNFGRNN